MPPCFCAVGPRGYSWLYAIFRADQGVGNTLIPGASTQFCGADYLDGLTRAPEPQGGGYSVVVSAFRGPTTASGAPGVMQARYAARTLCPS